MDPLLRHWWLQFGLGNVVQVTIPGRRTGSPRRTLLGLLVADGHWYLGHPNGAAEWAKNLYAADGRLLLTFPGQASIAFQAVPLPPGPERGRAIQATVQHPFPGNLIYGLARRHVQATGRYYRLDLDSGE